MEFHIVRNSKLIALGKRSTTDPWVFDDGDLLKNILLLISHKITDVCKWVKTFSSGTPKQTQDYIAWITYYSLKILWWVYRENVLVLVKISLNFEIVSPVIVYFLRHICMWYPSLGQYDFSDAIIINAIVLIFVWSYTCTQEFFTHMETSPLQVNGFKRWPILEAIEQ